MEDARKTAEHKRGAKEKEREGERDKENTNNTERDSTLRNFCNQHNAPQRSKAHKAKQAPKQGRHPSTRRPRAASFRRLSASARSWSCACHLVASCRTTTTTTTATATATATEQIALLSWSLSLSRLDRPSAVLTCVLLSSSSSEGPSVRVHWNRCLLRFL